MDINTINEEHQEFRDHLATVTKEGKRKWIFPKKPSGRFHNARVIVSIILLAFLIFAPFIKVNGQPLILMDFLNRRFILFSIPFGPHDFIIFALTLITFVVFIILFTVIFGRIFCGWACPQTVFMEMVFRKIEYWIEGDARDQIKLKNAPWTAEKIFKKLSKHSIFFAISFFISNIFLSYLIGMDKLIDIITDPPSKHLSGLIAITIFSGIFYFIFSYFREQVCTIVCPYGRLQGVLLDQDSIVIAYDYKRGEPRGKLRKGEDFTNRGDCIDCHLCVDVCPTGIDIRNGIQLECVNCTACIDACDSIMDKINRPRGLIRYASLKNIENKAKFKFTPRMTLYSVVLVILLTVLTVLLLNRSNYAITILRTRGTIFQEQPDNKISNLYDLNIVNKTFDNVRLNLRLNNFDGEIRLIGNDLNFKPQEIKEMKFMILTEKDKIKKMNTPVKIDILDNHNKIIKTITTSFLGPVEVK
ncbi:MAG: cytochrome c oxidase accessory protein CcoG [Ignavibacterium sp.]|nr:cytochrome c oxidase accessory protein CcoG [Ignavibacterium sp.]MDW8374542.1 cytochrome c oxidase accessory protein CcoG [Ignavibacteriales bacterium]